MKWIRFNLVLILSVFLSVLVGYAEKMYLVVGKTKVVDCPPDLKTVDIDDPEVVDVTIDEDKLLFTGKKVGEAMVVLTSSREEKQSYEIIVWERDIDRIAKRLGSALKNLGLGGNFKIKIDRDEGLIYLTGTVYTKDEMALVDQALSSCPSDVIVNLVKKNYTEDSVRLQLNVLEVGSSLARGLGIIWPQELRISSWGNEVYDESGNGVTLPDTIRFNIWHRSDVDFLLKALESHTQGKVLARPNILALNGEKAEITIGGEIPIISYEDNNAVVTYRSYGVILKMKPTIIRDGIRLEVECEVSDIDRNNGTSVSVANDNQSAIYNVPGFLVRKAKTVLSIKDGGTLVIGGLMKNKRGKSYTGLPGLSKLPIIGEFFKSSDTNNEDMELVITITPKIVHLREGVDNKRKILSSDIEEMNEEGTDLLEKVPKTIEDYKEYVREKIGKVIKKVFANADDHYTSGRVLLALKLDHDGKVVKISFRKIEGENKQVLRRMALNLIRDAQPFLPLPQDLEVLWVDVPLVFDF